jgi:hypothetical protein
VAAVAGVTLVLGAASAFAWAYTDIIDFNLTERAYTYGTYRISSSGDGSASYRWTDDPDHTTVISANSCGDLALYGKRVIAAHDTSYHGLFGGSPGVCFALRGRVAYGAGSMYNHDGRLRR